MKKGFTLIELLVVIAIIGILSSVVLVSLNSARNRGKDTRIIAGVQQLRSMLESIYSSDYSAGISASNTANNNGSGFSFSGTASTTAQQLLTDASSNSGKIYVTTDSTRNIWAIYGQLPSNTANYFCIDSTGFTNQAKTSNLTATNCN